MSTGQVESASKSEADACPSYEESVAYLQRIFESYGGPRRYLIKEAIRFVTDCIGKYGAEYHIQKLAKSHDIVLKEARFAIQNSRKPAQATPEEFQRYEKWAKYSKDMRTVAKVTRGTGVFIAGITASTNPETLTEAEKVRKMFDLFADVFDKFGDGLEKVATRYSGSLFSGKYDYPELQTKMRGARDDAERKEIVVNELKRKAASTSSFGKLLPNEKEKALERAVENGYRYTADVQTENDALKVDVFKLGAGLETLSKKQEDLQRAFLAQNKKVETKMGELGSQIDAIKQDQRGQFRFLLDINEDRMTAEQKLTAIEKFGYGDFKSDSEKEDRLSRLRLQAQVENLQAKVDSGLHDVVGVKAILANLGVKSKELDVVVDVATKGQTAINALGMFATQDYIGGMVALTSMFGAGGADAGAARHQQVMDALGTVISLQKKTIELQIKTMEMIEELAKSLDLKLSLIDRRVQQVLRLQSFTWINTYYEKLVVPMAGCRDLKRNWRENFIRRGMTEREFRQSMLGEPVGRGSNDTLLSTMAQKDDGFPVLSMADWQSVPLDKKDFEACYNDLMEIKTSLLEPFKNPSSITGGKLSVNPIFTLEGAGVAREGPDHIVDILDDQQLTYKPLQAFLRALLDTDVDMFDRVIFAALAPSAEGRELVDKLKAVHGTEAAKLLEEFRKDQAGLIEFYRSFANMDSTVFMNPHVLVAFIRHWQDFANLRPLMSSSNTKFRQPDLVQLFNSADNDDHVAALRVLNLVIVQQAIIAGDGLLAAIDKYWQVPAEPQKVSAVQDVVSDAKKLTIGRLAFTLLNSNRLLLHNYIRYKLASAFGDSPYLGYHLQTKFMEEQGDAFYLKVRLSDSELTVVPVENKDKQKEWFLQLAPKQSRFEAKEQKESFSEAEKGNLRGLMITLPSAEEFFEDRLVVPPVLADLFKARTAILVELFHHNHLPSGPKTAKEADRMVLEEMRKEVRDAGT